MDSGKQGGANTPKLNASARLGRGASVGRYLILGLLGKGGMGEVYAAYDPELDRKIALKLLRANTSAAGTDPSEGRARLLREAQAIARLSDPNVVVVFDVGMFGDRVFLAMEFVDGNTLGYWLQAKPRTWREVVATFAAAGKGLASAHRAGVVHRDFKPDNVMIGRDGKVRVMDFGLARTIEDATGEGAGDKPVRPSRRTGSTPVKTIAGLGVGQDLVAASAGTSVEASAPAANARPSGSLPSVGAMQANNGDSPTAVSLPPGMGAWTEADTATRDLSAEPVAVRTDVPTNALNSPLTETGAMMGTPAYMAPEQFESRAVDARTDQFSFCVALYEGLYGQRPFAGKNINDLSANVIAGRVRPAPAKARVPGWLRKVVLRGLRVDRAERYASMEVLLATLAHDPARTRRRWAAAASVAGLIAVLGVGLVRAERQQRTRCLGTDAKLVGIWELPGTAGLSPRKEAIRRAFMATGKRYAADSFTVVMNALDRYVTEWNDMHRDSCEATYMRGEQSAEVLDLRTSCLHDRFSEVRALTSVFSDANGDVVAKSVEAVQAIRPVEQCADIAALKAVVKPPDDPAVRRAVADVRTALADVKALAIAGKYKQASAAIPGVVVDARRTGYKPLVAEAVLQLGQLGDFAGDPARSEKNYEEAVWLAEASRYDEVALEAADQLIGIVGHDQGRYPEGERWARFAEAVLERLGPGHDTLAAWRANNLAVMRHRQGNQEDALILLREALAIKIRALGENHYDAALSKANLAYALFGMGRTDEAIQHNQRAIEIFKRTLGPDHPLQAFALANGAEFMNERGRYAEAGVLAERALTISERELDVDHPHLAGPLTAMGVSLVGRGQPALAIPLLERSLAIREARNLGPELLGDTRFALAQALLQQSPASNRAVSLAELARSDYEKSPSTKKQKAAIDHWIESRLTRPQRISMR